ncbi:MAG: prepilin peptidase [Desulfobacca sp.]|nr:prepilin peptidase [Desulfobacca sp.]
MPTFLNHIQNCLLAPTYLVVPLLLALWIAWGDVRTQRIPNYLTLSAALAGLMFQGVFQGWGGLLNGGAGLLLGFGLLLLPYALGGMGAGDVKALAALGAWLGPQLTLYLFIYMALTGGVLAVGLLWWRGRLWLKLRQAWVFVVNFVLCRHGGVNPHAPQIDETPGLPYGLAMAAGMVMVFIQGLP